MLPSEKSPVPAYTRLLAWPEVFNLNMAARLLGTDNDTAAIYLSRWKKRDMVRSTGERSGVYFNLVLNRNAADDRLVDALRLAYPSAVLIGESVLHNEGWTTQIPQKLQVACLARRSFPTWHQVEFHGRPREWFIRHHDGFVRGGNSFGLPALAPAEALADMFAHPAGHWLPDADDLDIPDELAPDVILAFEALGMELPERLTDIASPQSTQERYRT